MLVMVSLPLRQEIVEQIILERNGRTQKYAKPLPDGYDWGMNRETTPDYVLAHRHSIRHRTELEQSELCGCFFCLRTFRLPDVSAEWVDNGETLLCPFCAINSIIGSASGFPINAEFLSAMRAHWF